ncbi:MAG: hypothetical protein WAM53_11635 [Terrimicrobiaceae bacterium]
MKTRKLSKSWKGSLIGLLFLFAGIGSIPSVQAQSSGQTLNINGKGFGDVTATSTTGFIVGAGILNGTTKATFTDIPKPSGGGLLDVDPRTVSYVATLVITTKRGCVTTQDVGIFDTLNGKFSSVSRVIGGTGRFKGATGFLFFHGDVRDGRFIDEISGEIELP